MLFVRKAVKASTGVDKDCTDVTTFAMFLERHRGILLSNSSHRGRPFSCGLHKHREIESAGALVAE